MELLRTENDFFYSKRFSALQQHSFALSKNTQRFAFIMLTWDGHHDSASTNSMPYSWDGNLFIINNGNNCGISLV